MAETEDQQDSVAQNEDDQYEPQDQTLEPEQYDPQDRSLEPHQYKPQEQSLEPKTYEPQAQILELHQYKPQQQSLEPQKYEVNPDQKEYQEYQVQVQVQEQDRAHEEMQDQPLTKSQYQPQEQDHKQYQLQVQAHEHNGGGGTSKHVQSPLKSKLEDEEKRWPGWPGDTVFRMLVPAQNVGRIIGRKGDVINKIAEETRARIKILDGPPDTIERVVMISAKEEPESSLPPSINALLRVHMRIIDGLDNDSKISTRLLVPTYQAGNLIGKQGKLIKPIREATGSGSGVRVLGVEDVPVFSLQDDRVVQVVGEPSSVHKSLELIASYLRMFLVDPSIIPFFETQMKKPSMDPASHMHHQNISAYRREPPMNIHVSAAPSMAALQVSQQIQIPLSYTDAVIGESGLNISYTRRVSGALVNIPRNQRSSW